MHTKKVERNWTRLYWCIDLHDVIIEGKYNKFNSGRALAPSCAEVLKLLHRHKENCLILWTSSHNEAIDDILLWMRDDCGINCFDYVNENPEVPDNDLCSFKWKFYFNVLLDDKSGFSWEEDWRDIYHLLTTEIYTR